MNAVLKTETVAIEAAAPLEVADPTKNLILVPLSQLLPRRSKRNVRTTPRQSIPELAASIARIGLLQNLIVILAADGEDYEVVAGDRRLTALKLLAKKKRIPTDYEVPCLLVTYTPPGHDPEDALRKEADAAAASSVFFRSGGQGQAAATVAQAAPGAPGATSALAAFDPLAAGPASVAAQPADPTAVQNRQDQKEAFLKGGSTETRNSGNLALPASPYQVMAGTVIAGALVTGIKSDLPGDVIATVTEPVYDSATGKFLLIPQGSRILGRYNSQVSYGQSRVQVVWNRVILPDTSSLALDNLVGTDPAGYAGLEDDVDWHWDRIVAGAVLTTLLGVGAELAAPENRQDGNRIVIAGRDSAQDSINQVGQEMTRRNMNIQPTLTTRPGLPVRIIVNRDLVLRPYQPLFFNRGVSQ